MYIEMYLLKCGSVSMHALCNMHVFRPYNNKGNNKISMAP